jgi:hypothetical protein
MPTGGNQLRRSPAHAGRLRASERLTLALAFVIVAAVIVALSIPRGPSHPAPPRARQTEASQAETRRVQDGGARASRTTAGEKPSPAASGDGFGTAVLAGPGSIRFQDASARSVRLATALGPVLRHRPGTLAAGVVDAATGAVAVFRGERRFRAASIVRADILAALLLEHQQAGTSLGKRQMTLAAEMIEDSSNQAAGELWAQIGGAVGLRYANQVLGLRQTTPGGGTDWRLTSSTVEDQLRLLADLGSGQSPLSARSRSYELGLMQHVAPGQAWGVTSAAAPGSTPAVENGWLPGGGSSAWLINSIGVISAGGHEVLVVVLSSGQPSESAGITEVEAAAHAAVPAVAGGHA